MGVPYEQAAANLDTAANTLFKDSTIRSVGIGRHEDEYGFFVVRNSAPIVPFGAVLGVNAAKPKNVPQTIKSVPLVLRESPNDITPHLKVPFSGPGSPTASSHVIEQSTFRPLCGGLQIQNFDNDVRTGMINQGFIIIGTLGCFVKLANGKAAILSNNHVVAGENHGKKGTDRILQAGASAIVPGQQVATLTDFTRIRPSAPGANVATGAILNLIDAGVATLANGVAFGQGYHPTRLQPKPTGVATPKVGDRVFKVGRTTGLTFGEIKSVATVVGPVQYKDGPSWFARSIVIEGLNGTMFSDHGDSGSAIMRASGDIVGLLYAGNGTQTYACPIDEVFKKLKCKLL
ncbi:MAG: trypsin-like serine protease [Pyrinomonadaceae bacterium]